MNFAVLALLLGFPQDATQTCPDGSVILAKEICPDAKGSYVPGAHAAMTAILNSTYEGFETPLGWFPDLITYSASGTGCTTNIKKHQREVRQGTKYIQSVTYSQTIDWSHIDEIEPTTISNARNNPFGVKLTSDNGTVFVYSLMSKQSQDRFIEAADRLQIACY